MLARAKIGKRIVFTTPYCHFSVFLQDMDSQYLWKSTANRHPKLPCDQATNATLLGQRPKYMHNFFVSLILPCEAFALLRFFRGRRFLPGEGRPIMPRTRTAGSVPRPRSQCTRRETWRPLREPGARRLPSVQASEPGTAAGACLFWRGLARDRFGRALPKAREAGGRGRRRPGA